MIPQGASVEAQAAERLNARQQKHRKPLGFMESVSRRGNLFAGAWEIREGLAQGL